jgi:hypothetical protein
MKQTPTKKPIIWIAAALVLVAALYFGWRFAGFDSTAKVAEPVAKAPSSEKKEPSTPVPVATTPETPGLPPGPVDHLMTAEEGDQYIDTILRSEKSTDDMAKDLAKLVGRFNGEAQVSASRHLVNLTSDEDYGLIAGYLTDAKMNPEVIEVLFSDLMNRKRELQLPLFMNILKNPQHPQNEQVRNVMTILASEDFGNDYAAWDKWVSEELKRIQSEQ